MANDTKNFKVSEFACKCGKCENKIEQKINIAQKILGACRLSYSYKFQLSLSCSQRGLKSWRREKFKAHFRFKLLNRSN